MERYRRCDFGGRCSECGMHSIFLYEKRFTSKKGVYLCYNCMLDDKYRWLDLESLLKQIKNK